MNHNEEHLKMIAELPGLDWVYPLLPEGAIYAGQDPMQDKRITVLEALALMQSASQAQGVPLADRFSASQAIRDAGYDSEITASMVILIINAYLAKHQPAPAPLLDDLVRAVMEEARGHMTCIHTDLFIKETDLEDAVKESLAAVLDKKP